jgi:hypothetical protein
MILYWAAMRGYRLAWTHREPRLSHRPHPNLRRLSRPTHCKAPPLHRRTAKPLPPARAQLRIEEEANRFLRARLAPPSQQLLFTPRRAGSCPPQSCLAAPSADLPWTRLTPFPTSPRWLRPVAGCTSPRDHHYWRRFASSLFDDAFLPLLSASTQNESSSVWVSCWSAFWIGKDTPILGRGWAVRDSLSPSTSGDGTRKIPKSTT